MIASLTFTYQNHQNSLEREELFSLRTQDQNYDAFKNKLDYNIYVFHNCNLQYTKYIFKKHLQKNHHCYYLNVDGTYPKAFQFALNHFKKNNITRFIFMQDDVFSSTLSLGGIDDQYSKDSIDSYQKLAEYLKTTNLDYLNLEIMLDENPLSYLQDLSVFKIAGIDKKTLNKNKLWSFDDSPYYSTLDYAMSTIYDFNYYSKSNIWEAEQYLKYKFDNLDILKNITIPAFFTRFYLVGPNAKYLRQKYLIEISKKNHEHIN
jgi:hypothetical protein